MADIQVPSIAVATPAAADTVLGVQGGAVKRMSVAGIGAHGSFSHSGTYAAGSLGAKAQGVVSVKDAPFNAVGDGTTDDRSALDAAQTATEAAGATLVYPAGTYLVGSALTIAGSIRFERGAKIKPASGIAVTVGLSAVIHADADWQDTSAGGSFTISGGAAELRFLTKSEPTAGYTINLGSPANSIDESSSTSFVFGGTASAPHTLGAASELSVIGGGYDNSIGGTATGATIAGGAHHVIADGASHGTIVGGSYQSVNAAYGFAGGGTQNTVEGTFGVVCGGQSNFAGLTGAADPLECRSAFVGAGANNVASGLRSVVVGGSANTSTANESVVGGGLNNDATADATTVSGGSGNTASAQYATVLGGVICVASGTSSIAGGDTATASANYAVALGEFLEASGTGAMATGSRSKAPLRCQRAHAAGYFAAKGDAQISDLVPRAETTTATPKAMDLFGGASNKLVLPANTTWLFCAYVVARRTDADGENAAYKLEGCIKRDGTAGSTALVGTVVTTVMAEDTVAWNVAATADATNGALLLTVTGEASKTIRWVARVELTEVAG